MDAFCIVYPQFWLEEVNEAELQRHVGVLKVVFGQQKEIQTSPEKWEWTPELLSSIALEQQLECFWIAMLHNSLHAMRAIDPHIHPMTKLWHNLSLPPMLSTVFSEFYKLAEMAMIMVLSLPSSPFLFFLLHLFLVYLFVRQSCCSVTFTACTTSKLLLVL
jgi:hypothetical protein